MFIYKDSVYILQSKLIKVGYFLCFCLKAIYCKKTGAKTENILSSLKRFTFHTENQTLFHTKTKSPFIPLSECSGPSSETWVTGLQFLESCLYSVKQFEFRSSLPIK